jgi:hypothetical protein
MCVNMEAQGFCQTVEPDADDIVKYCDDRLFLTAILRSIPTRCSAPSCARSSARSPSRMVSSSMTFQCRLSPSRPRQ